MAGGKTEGTGAAGRTGLAEGKNIVLGWGGRRVVGMVGGCVGKAKRMMEGIIKRRAVNKGNQKP